MKINCTNTLVTRGMCLTEPACHYLHTSCMDSQTQEQNMSDPDNILRELPPPHLPTLPSTPISQLQIQVCPPRFTRQQSHTQARKHTLAGAFSKSCI